MKNKDYLLSRQDALKLGLGITAGLTAPASLLADSNTKPVQKAKSVIQIWLWGGPSQLDTFDPKPDAGYDYIGPYKKPLATNVDGIQISEKLPMLSKIADQYSIIRSMTHGVNAHETASYFTQTGNKPGRLVLPCAGAVISKLFGYDNGYKITIPPYIVLTKPQGRFSESGILGSSYNPFSTGGDPNKNPFIVEGIIAKDISENRQQKRKQFLKSLDTLGHTHTNENIFHQFNQSEEDAYKLMFGEMKSCFNLEKEKTSTRDFYGRNTFGQSCLMARRLVEQGVPYITINYKGWDTHKQHFQIIDKKLPELDKGLSALLTDLKQHGLLDNTIVWCGGEFGRSPKIQWKAPWNGGRSHHGHCFSTLVAGGGFKGGNIVGKSDDIGHKVAIRPVTPANLIGSIYNLMGINCNDKLPNHRNLDLKILPNANEGDGLLSEIM
jgi:hypothetical protein